MRFVIGIFYRYDMCGKMLVLNFRGLFENIKDFVEATDMVCKYWVNKF